MDFEDTAVSFLDGYDEIRRFAEATLAALVEGNRKYKLVLRKNLGLGECGLSYDDAMDELDPAKGDAIQFLGFVDAAKRRGMPRVFNGATISAIKKELRRDIEREVQREWNAVHLN